MLLSVLNSTFLKKYYKKYKPTRKKELGGLRKRLEDRFYV
jgi:hypothetical protein